MDVSHCQSDVDLAPDPTTVRAFVHASARCPRIKGGRRRWVNYQGVNNFIRQAGVYRTPTLAAVRAFVHAIDAQYPRIEGSRRRWVNY